MDISFRANFLVLFIVIISAMKCSPFTMDISSCIQNDNSKLMRRDTIAVRGFLLECFLFEGYVHTWECPGWKKTENVNGGGHGGCWGGGGVHGGGWNKGWSKNSGVEKFRKIN